MSSDIVDNTIEDIPIDAPDTSTTTLSVLEATLLATPPDPDRRALEVTLIRPGRSHNGFHYDPDVLASSVPLWEGAAAFLDHPTALDLTRAGQRSLRDLVGVYHGVRFDPSSTADPGGLRATLLFYPSAAPVFDLAARAVADRAAGRPTPDVGVSADLRVALAPGPDKRVARITRVLSADLVFQPSAGGSFDRVLEARHVNEGGNVSEPTTVDQPATQPEPAAEPPVATNPVPTPNTQLDDGLRLLEATRRASCAELLRLKLAASDLPEPARATLRDEFVGRVFEADDLDRRVDSLKAMLGEIFGGATVKGMGATRPDARVGLSPLERVQLALDRLFDLPISDAHAGIPRLSGVREAYVALTGDTLFRGVPNWENAVVREANEVTNAVLANALPQFYSRALGVNAWPLDGLYAQWARWRATWSAWGVAAPLIAPVGETFGEATADDVRAFEAAARRERVAAWSYWALDHMRPEHVAALSEAEPILPREVTAALDGIWSRTERLASIGHEADAVDIQRHVADLKGALGVQG